ncbi:MAG TPA: cobalamin-independent methionine synthase II family protein [Chloroflexota bacterium]|nr:cobalamin-independent methionine synthase II family protein [Chloroflexota bacterium]
MTTPSAPSASFAPAAPAVQTTVVGSYPMPEWLRAYPTRDHLRDAAVVVVRTQELAGIDVLSDGELSRFDVNHPETNGMIDYFVGQLDGVSTRISAVDAADFRAQVGMGYRAAPAAVVTGELGPGTLDLSAAAAPLAALTSRRTKFTLTSPYMLAKVLLDRHYGDRQALGLAIARILKEQVSRVSAAVIQVDEANIAGSPQDASLAAEQINVVLEGVPDGTERALHLCFGNYGGQTIQRGHYEQLVGFLNLLKVDHVVLEFARRGYAELDRLKDLDARIGVGLGVVDIKDLQVEAPEEIARRLEHADRTLGPGRVRYAHPDCGMWMLPRNVADGKLRSLASGRDLFLGA